MDASNTYEGGFWDRCKTSLVAGASLLQVAALCGGCSVLNSVSNTRTRRLARRGVVPREAQLGPDHITYWEGGEGEDTVVFLHGFGGNALFQWYPQMRRFSSDFRVIAPDLLWFGGSSSSQADHSIQHQARAVMALLEHESVDKFHIVGLSYGGMVTHEVLAHTPIRAQRVVLVASPARAFLADDKRDVLAELGLTSVEQLLLPEQPSDMRRLLTLAYAKPPRMPDFVAKDVIRTFYAPRRAEHRALLNSVERNTAEHRTAFDAPLQPTLIIWGREDRVFPEKAAWRLKAELGDKAAVCVFDDAAHAPHLERERLVSRTMHTFLQSHEAPSCEPMVAKEVTEVASTVQQSEGGA